MHAFSSAGSRVRRAKIEAGQEVPPIRVKERSAGRENQKELSPFRFSLPGVLGLPILINREQYFSLYAAAGQEFVGFGRFSQGEAGHHRQVQPALGKAV